nr:hypothetical protein [uncultured Methanospirillum sp.]
MISSTTVFRGIFSAVGAEKRPAMTGPVRIDQTGKRLPIALHQKRARLRVPELEVPIKHPGNILTGNPGLELFFGEGTFA